VTAPQGGVDGDGQRDAPLERLGERVFDELPRLTRGRSDRPPIWTDERIRRELGAFCAGRGSWPSATEFRSSGHGDLYHAVYRYGGVGYWAEDVGLGPSAPSLPRRAVSRVGRWWFGRPWAGRRLPLVLAVLAISLALGAGTAAWRSVPPHAGDSVPSGVFPPGGAGADEPNRRAARTLAAHGHSSARHTEPNRMIVLVGVGGGARVVVRNKTSRGRLLFAGVLGKASLLRLEGRQFWIRLGAPQTVRLVVDGRRVSLWRGTLTFLVTDDGVRQLRAVEERFPRTNAPQRAPAAPSPSDAAIPIAASSAPTGSATPPTAPSDSSASSEPPASPGSSADRGPPSPDPPPPEPTPDQEPR
jgi:hypothetical protein